MIRRRGGGEKNINIVYGLIFNNSKVQRIPRPVASAHASQA